VTITELFFFGVLGDVIIVLFWWPFAGESITTPLGRVRFGDIGNAFVLSCMLSALVSLTFNVAEAPIGGSLTSCLT
jgi:hypothetical protein